MFCLRMAGPDVSICGVKHEDDCELDEDAVTPVPPACVTSRELLSDE